MNDYSVGPSQMRFDVCLGKRWLSIHKGKLWGGGSSYRHFYMEGSSISADKAFMFSNCRVKCSEWGMDGGH